MLRSEWRPVSGGVGRPVSGAVADPHPARAEPREVVSRTRHPWLHLNELHFLEEIKRYVVGLTASIAQDHKKLILCDTKIGLKL